MFTNPLSSFFSKARQPAASAPLNREVIPVPGQAHQFLVRLSRTDGRVGETIMRITPRNVALMEMRMGSPS